MLVDKLGSLSEHDLVSRQVLKEWVIDVFIDKAYEIHSKVVVFRGPFFGLNSSLDSFRRNAVQLASSIYRDPSLISNELAEVKNSMNSFIDWVEIAISTTRQGLWDSNWTEPNLGSLQIITPQRKKYVKARDEIARARELAETNPEDVMGHLRTAIDLAIKERFKIKKIPFMKKFFEEAVRLDFHLPSYDIIYYYFYEGSQRLHSGKVHTSFEITEVTKTVSNFIDELELIQVTDDKIHEFAKNCKCVEI